jgi:glycine dehydrogenase
MSDHHIPPLPYDASALPRERARHYIPVSEQEVRDMCAAVGVAELDELFHHIPPDCRMALPLTLPEDLPYDALYEHMVAQSRKNRLPDVSFVGDALSHYAVQDLVPYVASLRELLTAYTPYQPERSQGTLMTQWLYQSCLVALTGFEAINASQYDRASALVEALYTAARLSRYQRRHFLLAGSLFPQDVEVVQTLLQDTSLTFEIVPIDAVRGTVSLSALGEQAAACEEQLAAIVFPQVGSLGCLEDVDRLTDLAHAQGAKAIVVIDPMLLATGGLKPPGRFGGEGLGADLLVGEGQPLAIAPHFGGPGLGIFGVRCNSAHKQDIRNAPGRFVGAGSDSEGRAAKLLVLSTREQHIRREKATSNICTNQGFVATLAAAAILGRGEQGMQASCIQGHDMARLAARTLTSFSGVELAFPQTPFWNMFTVTVPDARAAFIEAARQRGIHIGVDVSARIPGSTGNHLQFSFSDVHTPADIERLSACFTELLGAPASPERASARDVPVPTSLRRQTPAQLPDWDTAELKTFFAKLSEQNISPDLTCYPLGSCTMKYNPYLHEAVANLPGFALMHPEAPMADTQGTLEVLYEIQAYFKAMTGLAAVTTQPVAGAQGELVGLKLFQAYHRSRGEAHRDIVLIPHSAHGTNPATATVAGFETIQRGNEVLSGVVEIEADPNGQMNVEHVRELLGRYQGRVAGVMITNPNTSGVFELNFREVARMVHEDGGLVYMDGANMNAIAGWVDLGALGVDAVHNNLHKTWSIPHGGGGPGDAIVAVSERLVPFLPGYQVVKTEQGYALERSPESIGSVHRHFGNVAHKIRAYTYLRALGREGVRRMSAMAVLAARYVHTRLKVHFPTLPKETVESPRMHEFIITLPAATFERLEAVGIHRNKAIGLFGKLFLDFGFHAPTVSFPEAEGLMIEPTESYTRDELDRFADAVILMLQLVDARPTILLTVPHFTPVDKIDDVTANKQLVLSEPLTTLPEVLPNRIPPVQLATMPLEAIAEAIREASSARLAHHQ